MSLSAAASTEVILVSYCNEDKPKELHCLLMPVLPSQYSYISLLITTPKPVVLFASTCLITLSPIYTSQSSLFLAFSLPPITFTYRLLNTLLIFCELCWSPSIGWQPITTMSCAKRYPHITSCFSCFSYIRPEAHFFKSVKHSAHAYIHC